MAKERKKAEPKPVDLDAEAGNVLLDIAQSNEPRRFTKGAKGSHTPLFSKTSEKVEKIVEKCRDAVNPLVAVLDEGTPTERLELTPAGVDRVATLVEAKGRAVPLDERLAFFADDTRRKLIPVARYEAILAEITAAVAQAEAAKEEVGRRVREAEAAEQRKLELLQKALTEQKALRVARLQRELAADGAPALPPQPAPAQTATAEPPAALPKLPMPANDDEKDFRRMYARRLITAWHQAIQLNNADGQRFLEAALYNLEGIHVVGEPGEIVALDPTYHDLSAGVAPGEKVRIVVPGWWLEELNSKHILLRAVVQEA